MMYYPPKRQGMMNFLEYQNKGLQRLSKQPPLLPEATTEIVDTSPVLNKDDKEKCYYIIINGKKFYIPDPHNSNSNEQKMKIELINKFSHALERHLTYHLNKAEQLQWMEFMKDLEKHHLRIVYRFVDLNQHNHEISDFLDSEVSLYDSRKNWYIKRSLGPTDMTKYTEIPNDIKWMLHEKFQEASKTFDNVNDDLSASSSYSNVYDDIASSLKNTKTDLVVKDYHIDPPLWSSWKDFHVDSKWKDFKNSVTKSVNKNLAKVTTNLNKKANNLADKTATMAKSSEQTLKRVQEKQDLNTKQKADKKELKMKQKSQKLEQYKESLKAKLNKAEQQQQQQQQQLQEQPLKTQSKYNYNDKKSNFVNIDVELKEPSCIHIEDLIKEKFPGFYEKILNSDETGSNLIMYPTPPPKLIPISDHYASSSSSSSNVVLPKLIPLDKHSLSLPKLVPIDKLNINCHYNDDIKKLNMTVDTGLKYKQLFSNLKMNLWENIPSETWTTISQLQLLVQCHTKPYSDLEEINTKDDDDDEDLILPKKSLDIMFKWNTFAKEPVSYQQHVILESDFDKNGNLLNVKKLSKAIAIYQLKNQTFWLENDGRNHYLLTRYTNENPTSSTSKTYSQLVYKDGVIHLIQ